jgi:hypothetical protein
MPDRHAVANALDDAQVMDDEQIGEMKLLMELLQEVDDLGLDGDVQGGDRFISDDEL